MEVILLISNISKRFLRDLDSYVVSLRPAHSFDFRFRLVLQYCWGRDYGSKCSLQKF